MDSSNSQSFRSSSSDSLGEEKKCNEHDNVAPTVPESTFDDILTTVREEEWYTVSQLLLHLIGIIISSVALAVIPDWHEQCTLCWEASCQFSFVMMSTDTSINRACTCCSFDSFNQFMVDCAALPASDARLGMLLPCRCSRWG